VVLSCTSDSSTTKTGRHDIAEILLKVALNTKKSKINQYKVPLSGNIAL
jgi:ABC-type dipeptide/oligopeptide/nickel transport system ATPase component